MKNKKGMIIMMALLSLTLVTGCGKKVTLANGDDTIVSLENSEISADSLYQELKDKYAASTLVDMIDREILNAKYKTDEEEEKYIDNYVTQIKSQCDNDQETFLSTIKSYFGVETEAELRELISLDYKRGLAIDDWIMDNLKDSEINDYYERKTIGDMKLSHILVKPVTNDSMTDDEQSAAIEEAYNKAKELIERLDNGEDFETLAKENSDDTGTAKNGGNLGYINRDNAMGDDFINAAIELEVGNYTSEPVKTSYGYSIILKVEQKEKPSLEDVKEEIKETLKDEKLENDSSIRYEALKKIREENGLQFKDEELKKAYEELMDELIENAKNSTSS